MPENKSKEPPNNRRAWWDFEPQDKKKKNKRWSYFRGTGPFF